MNDLTDTWALKQKWHVVPLNRLTDKKLQHVWLAGSSCDSDDKYTNGGEHVSLPKMIEGEDLFVAFLDTGAYQDSLASHHCLLSSPLKLVAQNGEIKVARKRETPEEVGKQFGW
jgi:arginine decarboxylase